MPRPRRDIARTTDRAHLTDATAVPPPRSAHAASDVAHLTDRRFVVLDCETTGFSPEHGDRVVSLALVTVDGGQVTDRWSSLCDPQRDTGPVHVHGLTNAHVADAPRFDALVSELVHRLAGGVLVAHNAGFDLRFLAAELERAGEPWLPETVLDTYALAQRFLPELANHRLGTCARALGVEHRPHRADSDAEATAALLLHLLHRAAAEGHTDLRRLTRPADRTLRTERRRQARCDAETGGLTRRHRAAHRTVEPLPEEAGVWWRALRVLEDERCPEAARLWARFGTATAPAEPVAAEALLTALRLQLARPVPDRREVAEVVTGLARLDLGRPAPSHLLRLFPQPAVAVAGLPACQTCWSCRTLGLCDTGSIGSAIVSHHIADHHERAGQQAAAEALSAHLPLLAAAGDLAALGRGSRYVGQAWEASGRAADAARLWQWSLDRGARDVVVFHRLSLYHERQRGDDATALALCEQALAHRRGTGGRATWEALVKRAERCRRRLGHAAGHAPDDRARRAE